MPSNYIHYNLTKKFYFFHQIVYNFVTECTRYNLDDEISTVDSSYLRIKEFIEVNRNLKNILTVLKDQNSSLQNSVVELQSMAEHIRQQATEALK